MSVSKPARFVVYGLAGWCSEVLTTGLRSHGRDGNWRLTGTTYLWMLPIYGLAGWCSEILTTGLRSHGRDGNWRLTGTTYLWMLPIYGVAAILFEPAHEAARDAGWTWWTRGLAWTAGIYVVEAASGELIRVATGEVPWDYARPRGRKPVPRHFRGLVRPAYAPVWFAVGLGMERLHDLLDRVQVSD